MTCSNTKPRRSSKVSRAPRHGLAQEVLTMTVDGNNSASCWWTPLTASHVSNVVELRMRDPKPPISTLTTTVGPRFYLQSFFPLQSRSTRKATLQLGGWGRCLINRKRNRNQTCINFTCELSSVNSKVNGVLRCMQCSKKRLEPDSAMFSVPRI